MIANNNHAFFSSSYMNAQPKKIVLIRQYSFRQRSYQNYSMKLLQTIFFTLLPFLLFSQNILTGISARYDDSFTEWIVYTDDEDETGEIKMRWMQRNDFTKWDYDIGGRYGRIETSRGNDLTEWRISGDEDIITMRPRFPRDISEWRITDNDKTIIFKTRYSNNGDEWLIETEKYGWFTIYTEYARDPRDWIIIDEMNEDVSMTMKVAMVFAAVFNASPRQ